MVDGTSMERAAIFYPLGHLINQTVTVMKAFVPYESYGSQRDNRCGNLYHINPNQYV